LEQSNDEFDLKNQAYWISKIILWILKLNAMRQNFNYFFRYTRSERNGLFGITIVTCVLWATPKSYPFLWEKLNKTNDNNTILFKELIALKAEVTRNHPLFPNDSSVHQLFSFNPNTANMETLTTLGLSPKVASTLVHFREKGGRFLQKEDLKKVYGLKTDDYVRLEDCIDLEATNISTSSKVQDVCQKSYLMFPFDPNTVTTKTLLLMGMHAKTVNVLSNFRHKKGKFLKKEDLKKIYGLSATEYARFEPYIQIFDNQGLSPKDTSVAPSATQANRLKKSANKIIDVNQASLENFLELRGIGTTFAARILQRRETLGGFVRIDQIQEVFGISDSMYRRILPQLKLDANLQKIQKILINRVSESQIRHPYLTRKQAALLIRYRLNHGSYTTLNDLHSSRILPDTVLERVAPYLSFE
jgi:competence protein ComEA